MSTDNTEVLNHYIIHLKLVLLYVNWNLNKNYNKKVYFSFPFLKRPWCTDRNGQNASTKHFKGNTEYEHSRKLWFCLLFIVPFVPFPTTILLPLFSRIQKLLVPGLPFIRPLTPFSCSLSSPSH